LELSGEPKELPPAVAQRFLEDMRAYFAEEDGHKRDEIAARQLHALRQQQPPREKQLSLSDVKAMFERIRRFMDSESQ
jgi:hypothetical protein